MITDFRHDKNSNFWTNINGPVDVEQAIIITLFLNSEMYLFKM